MQLEPHITAKESGTGWLAIMEDLGVAARGGTREEAVTRVRAISETVRRLVTRWEARRAIRVVAEAEWPHGLSCLECGRTLSEGEEFVERPNGVVDGVPATEIVCVDCGRNAIP